MAGRRVVRTLALSSTTRGFGFVVLEGPRQIVDWGLHRCPSANGVTRSRIETLVSRYQPAVGAVETLSDTRKRTRGRRFILTATETLREQGVLLIFISRSEVLGLTEKAKAKRWDVATVVAKRFPELAHRLPKPRMPWQSEDDAYFGPW